ncbi:alkene reductase [Alcaligenaceae bacterium CGII-47]|nr:alkene reductase [Alcaligenaceae bacterium CGII-47]
MTTLWTPTKIGSIQLSHRLAMAPMTRSRAQADGTPSPLAATYYAQRASLGLLISEGTQPSADGQGYLHSPGIHTPEHITAWREVSTAVHTAGGHLFIQIMHVGRMSHPDNTPHHRQAVAPSPLAPNEKMFTLQGLQEIPSPRALNTSEISATIEDYARAAAMAIEAGADGVEIHAANGYLIHQFLAKSANQRNDIYGGSIENRSRFALQVAAAVATRIGARRTGIRLSPGATLGGIQEGADYESLYRYLVAELAKLDLAYLHLTHAGNESLLRELRKEWSKPLLLNRGNRPLEALGADVQAGLADIETVGRWALANPDFIERLKTGAPLNTMDPATLYAGGSAGYTDYPFLWEVAPVGA